MDKPKRVRFTCTTGPMIEVYVQHLLKRGTFGDTRSEVVRRCLCNGIMDALSGETIQRLVKEHAHSTASNHDYPDDWRG